MTEFMAVLASVPNPGPGQAPPGIAGSGFITILGWAKWVGLGVVVAGIVVTGAMMAIQARRGEGGEHLGKLGMALGGAIVIAGAFSLVSFLVT